MTTTAWSEFFVRVEQDSHDWGLDGDDALAAWEVGLKAWVFMRDKIFRETGEMKDTHVKNIESDSMSGILGKIEDEGFLSIDCSCEKIKTYKTYNKYHAEYLYNSRCKVHGEIKNTQITEGDNDGAES